MRILTRYILREISSHSFLGLLIFTFIIYVRHLGYVLELEVRRDLPYIQTLLLFLLPLPQILVLSIPMAVLVGTLIGLSRMSADGEVIAARASGMGVSRFVRPVMLYALLGWGLTAWMSLWLAPQAARQLVRMEGALRNSQAPYEVQPRVFIEQYHNLLLYIEDVRGPHSRWYGVFMADNTDPNAPKVTLAESGFLVNAQRFPNHHNRHSLPDPQDAPGLILHLEKGAVHQIDPQHPNDYSVSSFSDSDVPIPASNASSVDFSKVAPPLLTNHDLLQRMRNPNERRAALVELNYRLALPVAPIVLALMALPLGLYTSKSGKASGVVVAILLVFVYYIIIAFGRSFAQQGRLDPTLGLWLANVAFALAALVAMRRMRRAGSLRLLPERAEDAFRKAWNSVSSASRMPRLGPSAVLLRPRAAARYRIFTILDRYVMRSWIFYFALLLVTFAGVYVIFDFFQLLGDIVRNQIGVSVVLNYYRYLSPWVLFQMLPPGILVATLVTFGLLAKTSQVTAVKSAGVSLYRVSVPVFVAAALLSAGMFVLEDFYLPGLNQRQDALRNQIKGKPPQTYFRPDREWIFGKSSRIYNYHFFDPDRNVFANLSVFEFDPLKFRITRRIYANRAIWEPAISGWVLENGWERDLDGDRVSHYMPFSVATFDELSEEPGYFKKEVKTSEQMSAPELRRYINELQQSGVDVVRLSVQFYRKFSFPLVAFIVVLIGFPFSLTGGSKGAVSGIALSIAVTIGYLSLTNLFEAMGNLHQLPPVVAAWSPDVLFGLGGTYLLFRVRT
jgi:LPS export ABC transporter permease LptG/LPS export ABC transporter permease LptF